MKRLLLTILIISLAGFALAQNTTKLKSNLTIEKSAPMLYLNGTSAGIDFYNGDVTLQQSSNTLTLGGGNFSLGANSLLGTGSIGAAGTRLLKGWFTDLDISNDLALTGSINITGASISNTELAALDGVTGSLNYSTENYGATGTGDIVLNTGPTLTTVNITDLIKLTPTASPPAGATEGMIYMDTDHHLYVHNGTTWVQLDN